MMWIRMSLYKSSFISPCLKSRYVMLMLMKIDKNKDVDVVDDDNKNAGQGQLITWSELILTALLNKSNFNITSQHWG